MELERRNKELQRKLEEAAKHEQELMESTNRGRLQKELQQALVEHRNMRQLLDAARLRENREKELEDEVEQYRQQIQKLQKEVNMARGDYDTIVRDIQNDNDNLHAQIEYCEEALNEAEAKQVNHVTESVENLLPGYRVCNTVTVSFI